MNAPDIFQPITLAEKAGLGYTEIEEASILKNAGLKASDITEAVLQYARKDAAFREYAIMIDGPWGSGKTYYWKNSLKAELNKESVKTIYVSLYGLEKAEQIYEAVYSVFLKEHAKTKKKFKVRIKKNMELNMETRQFR